MKLPESFILNFSRRQATPLEITRGKDERIGRHMGSCYIEAEGLTS